MANILILWYNLFKEVIAMKLIYIVDTTSKTCNQELVDDLIQIITVLSCRLQGRIVSKFKKMIKGLKYCDNNNKG